MRSRKRITQYNGIYYYSNNNDENNNNNNYYIIRILMLYVMRNKSHGKKNGSRELSLIIIYNEYDTTRKKIKMISYNSRTIRSACCGCGAAGNRASSARASRTSRSYFLFLKIHQNTFSVFIRDNNNIMRGSETTVLFSESWTRYSFTVGDRLRKIKMAV